MKSVDELQAKNNYIIPLLLALATIVTRIPFTSKLLYHMDSIQFALALDHFDVTVHQPHPPGYFLYVMLGRLLNFLIRDPNITFVTISIVFSALTVVAVYYLGKEFFDTKCAVIAALFAIASPNLWFHGEVALTYAVEAFFSSLVAFLCWKIYNGKESKVWLLAIIVAVAGGIRMNTPVFLLPLCLFSVSKLPLRKILAAICLCAGSSLLWFVPMTRTTGGLDVFIAAFRQIWASSTAHTVFDLGWPALQYHSLVLFNFVIYGIGGGIVLLIFCLYYIIRNRKFKTFDKSTIVFFSLWILPSFLFFLLIAIHPSVPGHVLIFLPPLLLLTAGSTTYLCNEMKRLINRDILVAMAFIVISTDLYIFFGLVTPLTYLEYPVSYTSIREQDKSLAAVIKRLKAFAPSSTLLFLSQNKIYWGLSQGIFYLPEYAIYDPKVISHPITEHKKIWGGYNKKTFLTDKIVLPENIKYFATLLITDDKKEIYDKGDVKIERLSPYVYLASGSITSIKQIYPELEIHPDTVE